MNLHHIHHFTSLPMLVMSDEAKTDRKLQRSQRLLNTSVLNVDYFGKPTEAGIERRSEVRDELVNYLSIHMKISKEDVISLIPPIHSGLQPKIPLTRGRGRRVIVPSIRLVVMKVMLRSQN